MQLVDSSAGLQKACAALASADTLFIDTEFEANRYERVLCLLQISAGEEIYLIDTLRLKALEPLQKLLSDAQREWVLHAGTQDVELITSLLSLPKPGRLFDTQLAWALLGPEYSVSLAYLQFRLLGVRVGKGHQADDWSRRPLPASQLAYASSDIEHLPALRKILGERAEALGRLNMVFEASREALFPEPEEPKRLSLSTFRNAWQLDAPSQAVLRFLIGWYNELGENERRAAPEPKTLLSIASRLPESGADLARIKGVPRHFAASKGEAFAARLVEAAAAAQSHEFVPIDPPPYATFQEIRVDGFLNQVRAELCAKLSVAPELAIPSRVLKRMRSALLSGDSRAGLDTLSGWRRELLEQALLEHLERQPPPLIDANT